MASWNKSLVKHKDNVVIWVDKGRVKEDQGRQERLRKYDNEGLKSRMITCMDIVKFKCIARYSQTVWKHLVAKLQISNSPLD